MALPELIAQKRNSKKRKFWNVNTTILQWFKIENVVTEAKFIYMFRHVTKAKNTLLDKTLSEIYSVSNYHNATSHFIPKILFRYSQAKSNIPLCHQH